MKTAVVIFERSIGVWVRCTFVMRYESVNFRSMLCFKIHFFIFISDNQIRISHSIMRFISAAAVHATSPQVSATQIAIS